MTGSATCFLSSTGPTCDSSLILRPLESPTMEAIAENTILSRIGRTECTEGICILGQCLFSLENRIETARVMNWSSGAVLLAFAAMSGLRADDIEAQSLRDGLTPVYRTPAAPELDLTDIDGNRYRLSALRGKVVVINFWATWCPPCLAEMPAIQQMWNKLHGDRLEVLAVNIGEDVEAITRFLAEFQPPIKFPILLDKTGEAFQQWRVRGLPTTFVVDKQGRMMYEATGGRDLNSDHIRGLLHALMEN